MRGRLNVFLFVDGLSGSSGVQGCRERVVLSNWLSGRVRLGGWWGLVGSHRVGIYVHEGFQEGEEW